MLDFAEVFTHGFQRGRHLVDLAQNLERLERREIDRMVVAMPPRHGKSKLTTESFTAWYVGRNPTHHVIISSYAYDLAASFGREIRNIVASKPYQAIFPGVLLAPDAKAINTWRTVQGGQVVATGVGGAMTGLGAHLLIVDDPFKGIDDASSAAYRDRLWDWFRSVAYTRLAPGGVIVVIQTRWHEDDLVGRLTSDENLAHEWVQLKYRALSEEGEPLFPERFSAETLDRTRKMIGEQFWYALYQQEPRADEGIYFIRQFFKRYKPGDHPKGLRFYGASDFAVSDRKGDFTEHGIFGFDDDDGIWLVDWWSKQSNASEWIDAQIDLIAKWRPLIWFGESGIIQKGIEPFMVRRMTVRQVFCSMRWLPSIVDKTIRARSFQAVSAMASVNIPSTPWGDRLIEQLISFPSGKNDDGVDVCSLIGRGIDEAVLPFSFDRASENRQNKRNDPTQTGIF